MGVLQRPKKEKRGVKVLAYGETGVGKSKFSLTFPRCAVADTEDGQSHYVGDPNMVFRVVTTSAVDVEEAIDEVANEFFEEVDTFVLDSETKMYENLQHSGLVVVERRARENARDPFGEGLSQKEWGKIKLVHKRINSKLIELAGRGKNIVVITQLSDKTKQMGDNFVKIGEKPNGVKGLEYDFDIVIKLCYDKETDRRYGIIEKDRTETFPNGAEVNNPSFELWRHIFEASKFLDDAHIDLNKDIGNDTREFEEVDDLQSILKNITALIKKRTVDDKTMSNKMVVGILEKFGAKKPKDITSITDAKELLLELEMA
jgi:hypothetical protein